MRAILYFSSKLLITDKTLKLNFSRDHRGRMVVRFTTTCAISTHQN